MFGKSASSLVAVLPVADAQAADPSLEPALNGAVSTSGRHLTRLLEDQTNAYLDGALHAPYCALRGIAAPPREGRNDTDHSRPPREPIVWPVGADSTASTGRPDYRRMANGER